MPRLDWKKSLVVDNCFSSVYPRTVFKTTLDKYHHIEFHVL